MTKEKAIEVLNMFLYKQCDLERTAFAYDENIIWNAVNFATEALKAEPKQGEWIINWDDRHRRCTNCNDIWWFDYGSYDSNYCPNCGAKMHYNDEVTKIVENCETCKNYTSCKEDCGGNKWERNE